MDDAYTVKRKNADGKYRTFGNVKKNQFGNYQLGLRATAELKALIAEAGDGDWVNFNMFAEDGERKASQKPRYAGDDRDAPF